MSFPTELLPQILYWKTTIRKYPTEDSKVDQIVQGVAKDQKKKITLSFRPLNAFPVALCGLMFLEKLNLSNCLLSTIPSDIGKLKKLTYLDLSVNELRYLPSEISALVNVKELILYGNKLFSLPPEIGSLTNLMRLDVGCNRLMTLRTEISKLKKLEELIVLHNSLQELPEMGGLFSLLFLDIADNPDLALLPNSLKTLKELSAINIKGTSISLSDKISILGSTRLNRGHL